MFSMMTVPRCGLIRSAHGRPRVSNAPPGGNGTISRIGRSGYVCANAPRGAASSAEAEAAAPRMSRRENRMCVAPRPQCSDHAAIARRCKGPREPLRFGRITITTSRSRRRTQRSSRSSENLCTRPVIRAETSGCFNPSRSAALACVSLRRLRISRISRTSCAFSSSSSGRSKPRSAKTLLLPRLTEICPVMIRGLSWITVARMERSAIRGIASLLPSEPDSLTASCGHRCQRLPLRSTRADCLLLSDRLQWRPMGRGDVYIRVDIGLSVRRLRRRHMGDHRTVFLDTSAGKGHYDLYVLATHPRDHTTANHWGCEQPAARSDVLHFGILQHLSYALSHKRSRKRSTCRNGPKPCRIDLCQFGKGNWDDPVRDDFLVYVLPLPASHWFVPDAPHKRIRNPSFESIPLIPSAGESECAACRGSEF